ncbi:MAG: zinc ribbon domain-containing protein [Christensenellales bacterium]
MEPGLDPALLAQYQAIKKNRANPVALVENEQCQGCNMSLPSLTLSRLRDGKEIVECENCGRILYDRQNQTE